MLMISQDGSIRLNYEQLVMVGLQPVFDEITAIVAQGGSGPVYIVGVYSTYEDAEKQINLAQAASLLKQETYRLRDDADAVDFYIDNEEYQLDPDNIGLNENDGSGILHFLRLPHVQSAIAFITAFLLGYLFRAVW